MAVLEPPQHPRAIIAAAIQHARALGSALLSDEGEAARFLAGPEGR
jgi:hypothetical protein